MFVIKHFFFLVFVTNVWKWRWKIFKEEESTEISKIFGLINNIEKYENI